MFPVDPQTYTLFIGVMLVLAFTPGPANLFAIATGLGRGTGAVLVGVAGMNVATLVWFAGAALGLGALMVSYPAVFEALRWLGAGYLVWLAISAFRTAFLPNPLSMGGPSGNLGWRGFRDGFAVQIANPKALLFFTAVLPPFMDAARPALPQLGVFAATTLTADVVAMTAYGLTARAFAARASEPGFRRGFNLLVGALMLTAAILTVVPKG